MEKFIVLVFLLASSVTTELKAMGSPEYSNSEGMSNYILERPTIYDFLRRVQENQSFDPEVRKQATEVSKGYIAAAPSQRRSPTPPRRTTPQLERQERYVSLIPRPKKPGMTLEKELDKCLKESCVPEDKRFKIISDFNKCGDLSCNNIFDEYNPPSKDFWEILGVLALKHIDLSNNKLQSLPIGFQTNAISVNLKTNDFKELPRRLTNNPYLKELNVQDNPLRDTAAKEDTHIGRVGLLDWEEQEAERILHIDNHPLMDLKRALEEDGIVYYPRSPLLSRLKGSFSRSRSKSVTRPK